MTVHHGLQGAGSNEEPSNACQESGLLCYYSDSIYISET